MPLWQYLVGRSRGQIYEATGVTPLNFVILAVDLSHIDFRPREVTMCPSRAAVDQNVRTCLCRVFACAIFFTRQAAISFPLSGQIASNLTLTGLVKWACQ